MTARRLALAPTSEDLRRWKRLVRVARGLVDRPTAAAGDLRQAARDARRSVAPHWNAFDACCALVRLGQKWCDMNNAQRREKAAELGKLADQVEAAVEAHVQGIAIGEVAMPAPGAVERPKWTRRADIGDAE